MTDTDPRDGAPSKETTPSEDRSVTVDRVIEAPPERVYDAFVDPDERNGPRKGADE